MTVLEKLTLAIEQGHPNETEELVRKALEEGVDPVVLVEDVMVPVMLKWVKNIKNSRWTYPEYSRLQEVFRKGFKLSRN